MCAYNLANLIRARFPLIYITTFEEDRVTKYISSVAKSESAVKYPREVFVWTQSSGLKSEDKVIPNTSNPAKLIEFITKYDKDSIFILYDFHVFFGCKQCRPDPATVRSLRDLIPILKTSNIRKNIIFVSPELCIPDTLQKDIVLHDFPLPKLDEIKNIPRIVRHFISLIIIVIGWVIFRLEDTSMLIQVLKGMFVFNKTDWLAIFKINTKLVTIIPYLIIGIIFSLPIDTWFHKKVVNSKKIYLTLLEDFVLGVLFIIVVVKLVSNSYNPFIYFRF